MHDAFAIIRWRDAGISPAVSSMLWSELVGAEVLVFVLLGPWLLSLLGRSGALTFAAARRPCQLLRRLGRRVSLFGVVVHFKCNICAICVRATLSDFTGYEDVGNSGAAGTGIGPLLRSTSRPVSGRRPHYLAPRARYASQGAPAGPPDLGAARCVLRATPAGLRVVV